ncbi:hypothetical protein [Flavonifractor sp. An306]|uniref:hypothetical protein n=1 Tax=Flavonifractor sp. An306 TaxID=1965629 RepID=UPI001749003D|nr:hypothetical protein [Flavonifractor sp. An306]
MNTKINYLYRDASNYTVSNSCVIRGTLTEDQKRTILSVLDEGEYFIPHAVGMPERKFDTETEDDHPFFELTESDFEQTNERPTMDITGEALAKRFVSASMDGTLTNERKAGGPKEDGGSTMHEAAQRSLSLTIRMGEDAFEIDIYEPESGEVTRISHPYSFDGHPEFDKAIGAEIYSWLSLWKDELEDN